MWKVHLTSLAVAATAMVVYPAIADARPGGGARGGARASIGGGGGGARSMSRPPPQRQPAAANRGGGGQQADRQASAANRSGGSVNRSGNTVDRGGNRVNTGNINVGNDVNVNVDNGWGWGDRDYHPVAAGVAVGTAAAVTSAAITGARYYSLPPACSPYPYSGLTYYSCSGAYYMPQYEGDNVVYVVVDRPG